MKVLFFTTGMTAGGAERVIATLANEFKSLGHGISIGMIKGEDSAYPLAPEIKLESAHLSPGLKNLPAALRFYKDLVERETPDVIASFSTKSDLIALLAKTLLGVKTTLVVSERADPHSRGRIMQTLCNVLYPRANAVVCQSKYAAAYYSTRGIKANNIHVIANPINEMSIGEPSGDQRNDEIVMIGRLAPQKNHTLALSAFAELRKARPDLKLRIFGDGPLRENLQELIRAEGLEGSVVLEGVKPNVVHQHNDAALFLFTSNFEGYPNALLEAAATGIPVVTTDFSPGTAHDIITHAVNGYVVARGDKQEIVSASLNAINGRLDPAALTRASRGIREQHKASRIANAWLHALGIEQD